VVTSKDLILTGIIMLVIVITLLARSCVESQPMSRRQEAPHEAKGPYPGVAPAPSRISTQRVDLHG
jgi:hypothetical protein